MGSWRGLGSGGRVALVTVAVGLVLSGLYFKFEQRSLELYRYDQRERVTASLLGIAERLEASLNKRLFLTHSLESYVHARENITSEEFRHLATSLLSTLGKGEVRSLQIARGTTVEHVYPMQGNEAVLGLDLMSLADQAPALRRTIFDMDMVLAGPLDLVQGGKAVVARKPIFIGEGAALQYWGLATVIIDWETLLRESGIGIGADLQIALRGKDALGQGGPLFYGSEAVFGSLPVKVPVTVPGGDWILAGIPGEGWPAALPDQGAQRPAAGLVILLAMLSTWLLIRYPLVLREQVRRATHELERGKAMLEQRVEERTAELLESEQRMRRLIDTLPFPVAVTTIADGRYLYANLPAAEILDETLEYRGQRAIDYYDLPEQRQQMVERLQRDGQVLGFEVMLKTRTGKRFWALLSAVPIVYDGLQSLLVAITDINDRKQMEMALRESEHKLRTIFDSVQTPMAIVRRRDGVVLRVNAATQRRAGITDAHIGKITAQDIYCNPADRKRMLQSLDRHGSVHDMEVCLRNLGGEEGTMLLSAIGIEYEGEPCILSSYADITERKRIEQALHEANLEAEQAVRSKNEFLATMSHEIRTPLNGMLTMLQLLSRTELTEEQREYVTAIDYSGESLLTVLNDVLDLSKLEAGMLELEETDFDVHRLLDDMVRMMKPRIEQNRLQLHLQFDPRIPGMLRGDPARIRQVLFNLLGNAIKFTEVGEVELKAGFLHERGNSVSVEFSVRDTGIGIPLAVQGRLFESFTQADSSVARLYGGSGLGLAICRRMVELMGGRIGVVSEEGKGSVFWFRLDLVRATGQDREAPPPAAAEAAQLPPLRVLLVEDDAINRRAGSILLRREGMEVVTASDGFEALERFRDGAFDVVLMDVRMPGMDGLETTRRLREMDGGDALPVFALTADVTRDNVERCLAIGMNGVITKPIHIERLREALAGEVRGKV